VTDPSARRDEDLLQDHLAGSQRAFTELVRRHEDRVFALGLRMLGNRSDALDATQEAFVSAFRQARSFRGDSSFGTWLYRIAINACKDLLRKRSRWGEPTEDAGADRPTAEDLEGAVARRMDLAAALAQLPAEFRDPVVMHDLGGIPYEEIAKTTRTNIGTVKSRISRGRKRLAELLEHPTPPAASKDVR
jgi:RNA polymerase sigma-70 factor (ECF subfamily)